MPADVAMYALRMLLPGALLERRVCDQEEGGIGRRALIAAVMMGGAAAWWSYLNSASLRTQITNPGRLHSSLSSVMHFLTDSFAQFLAGQMPKVYRGKNGATYLKTKGGNTVGASMDEAGRVFFYDRAGNLYYDTGDKRLGFYIVRLIQLQFLLHASIPSTVHHPMHYSLLSSAVLLLRRGLTLITWVVCAGFPGQ